MLPNEAITGAFCILTHFHHSGAIIYICARHHGNRCHHIWLHSNILSQKAARTEDFSFLEHGCLCSVWASSQCTCAPVSNCCLPHKPARSVPATISRLCLFRWPVRSLCSRAPAHLLSGDSCKPALERKCSMKTSQDSKVRTHLCSSQVLLMTCLFL